MKSIKLFILLNVFILNLQAWQIGLHVKVIERPIRSENCEIVHLVGKIGEIMCECGEYYFEGWIQHCIYCVKIEDKLYRIPSSNLELMGEE